MFSMSATKGSDTSPATKGPMYSPAYDLMSMVARPGTEPGILDAETKPKIPGEPEWE